MPIHKVKNSDKVFVTVPESLQALQGEVREHPDLVEALALAQIDNFSSAIAVIGIYCGVILDGYYDGENLDTLYDILYKKLVEKRKLIIYN